MTPDTEGPSWAHDLERPKASSKKSAGAGSQWQALNISDDLIKSLLQRKFKSPTPIQRSSIPGALSTPPRDILGMARTGSGKTLAYLIPLLQKIGSSHSDVACPRALILCPSRELAVQIYSVGKDLARGTIRGKDKGKEKTSDRDGKVESLRWALIIGGEGLDTQFDKMSRNPDVVIATPGRFLHLAVEMRLDLRHLQVVVYDEADRLFEMGFDVQLREILSRLPPTRQNLLFSATLPSSVAEFAKAGLVNPLLIRLDSEHKISPDLDLRFFSVKPIEKDAALLVLLKDVIKVPLSSGDNSHSPQAIVFVSTKHHVDYINELLKTAGFRSSHIYSSLDQVARHQQLHHFRNRLTDVLVVTDVAARGLDIPVMDHVVNYDFPSGPRVFVHRVGRTARAGRKGNAWSLVTRDDWPYLFDLQTFLGLDRMGSNGDMLRTIPDDNISQMIEYITTSLDEQAPNLEMQRNVMRKGQAMFERSRGKADHASYRKAKLFGKELDSGQAHIPVDIGLQERGESSLVSGRSRLLSSVAAYTPAETIFEVGKRGDASTATLMKNRRKVVSRRQRPPAEEPPLSDLDGVPARNKPVSGPTKTFRDSSFYLDHSRQGADSEKGYSLQSGAAVPESLSASAFDMTADEGHGPKAQKASQLRWDRKKRKFVKNAPGTDNVKMIRTESGAMLPATYNSGRYNEWKAKRRNVENLSRSNTTGATAAPPGTRRTIGHKSNDPLHKPSTVLSSSAAGLLSAEAIRRQKLKAQQAQTRSQGRRRTR
ncbi:hypothetical protein I316_00739 [Kwoniella heveanensis BCC8398]|uniref:RNA helicase n=1 Tax=Kwoniella heveanensis BCC8398 TaxID=1296120 RepID=A0A1B9H2W7_9TREE|nr:hypothetical protein I316_00739 [Kwoniella heveanensis BCC8398]